MNNIIVTLMNAPMVLVDGEQKVFPYRKVEGLFYYICIKKRITRDEAIGIFWTDCDEQSARKNLRDALYHIKKVIGSDVIMLDGNVFISIHPRIHLTVDVDQVREQILDEYEGEVLKYFYIKNCLEFENWLEDYRRGLREMFIKASLKELETAQKERETEAVIKYAGKLLDALYLDEGLYRKYMDFLLKEGEYSAVINLYQRLEAAIKQDLDSEPEEETKSLMEKVLKLRRKMVERQEEGEQAFFGRQKELYEIYDCIQNHMIKKDPLSCNLILISGEGGVGKTSLINQLKGMLMKEGGMVFSYCCYASERELYLKAWNDILTQIQNFCFKRKQDLPAAKYFLSEKITDYKLFITQYGIHLESLFRAFCREISKGGFVLFIDDIQWMDSSSIQLLNNLLFRLRDCPITVVAASRLDRVKELTELKIFLMRESQIREIKLKRFTFEEAKELIGAQAGEILLEPGKALKLYEYTGGNALFLTELIKSIKENKLKCEDEEDMLKDGTMSSRTISIIESRLSNFPLEEQDLLSHMAVFSGGVSVEELQILSREPEMKICQLLEHLLEHQIIVEKVRVSEITYEITHALIKSYILAGISVGRRHAYNREVARYYEEKYRKNGDVALMPVLIYHYENANDTYKKYLYKLEYMKIFFACKEEIYPSMSAGFTDQMFLPDLKPGENVLVPLAKEIRALPENDRNYQELRMMVEYLIGRYDLSGGDYKKGLRNINASIEAAKYLKNGQYLMDGNLQMIYYAIQVYDLDMMKEYIDYCGKLLAEYDFSEESHYIVERLRALYFIKIENFKEATELLDKLIPKLERLHMLNPAQAEGLPACYNYRGEIFMKLEEWDEALASISKAVSFYSAKAPTAGLGISFTDIGIILYRMNNYDRASDYFKKARNCFQNLSIQWGRAKEEAYSALIELKLGKSKSALSHYSMACRYLDKDYSPHTIAILQDVYTQLKNIEGLSVKELPESFTKTEKK